MKLMTLGQCAVWHKSQVSSQLMKSSSLSVTLPYICFAASHSLLLRPQHCRHEASATLGGTTAPTRGWVSRLSHVHVDVLLVHMQRSMIPSPPSLQAPIWPSLWAAPVPDAALPPSPRCDRRPLRLLASCTPPRRPVRSATPRTMWGCTMLGSDSCTLCVQITSGPRLWEAEPTCLAWSEAGSTSSPLQWETSSRSFTSLLPWSDSRYPHCRGHLKHLHKNQSQNGLPWSAVIDSAHGVLQSTTVCLSW